MAATPSSAGIATAPQLPNDSLSSTLPRDLIAGIVVFLVALPLCLGVALASNAPLFSGLVAGIVGGILVGSLSGSHTSVSGPAAGLTAIVAAQIATLGSFDAFLLAVVLAGIIQIVLGVSRAGFIAAFFPSSVIKGLLAAIGVILILKQLPHVFGRDTDPEGEMSFIQPDHENTFSELVETFFSIHAGASVIGLASLALLVTWDKIPPLKKSIVPAPLIVVLFGVAATLLLSNFGSRWAIGSQHMVQVPVAASASEFWGFVQLPDFSRWADPAIYLAAITIALVASLETLLNLEAVDNIDPKRRKSPPSRELLVQGIGNVTAGMLGGIPLTSVIVRSSVNIHSGGQTKVATIFHGTLLLVCVALLPTYLNLIPLACLAAILLFTGWKLASPKLIKSMYREGQYQFVPFAVTVVAIVFTDLLIGILIGLGVATSFILYSNFRRPIKTSVEKRLSGEVTRIELANQVSFLNRAALDREFNAIPRGGHVLIDAGRTDYIDPDILDLIRDFKEKAAPVHGVNVSLQGFRSKFGLDDEINYTDYATPEIQARVTPKQVLRILKEGHERFVRGQRLNRNYSQQLKMAESQYPLAVVLGCIDSRAPTELVFDVGLGDIFSVRVAGNVPGPSILGSIEYACAVAKAKLILVMGHTRCGAVTTALANANSGLPVCEATGCDNVEAILNEIMQSADPAELRRLKTLPEADRLRLIDEIARENVIRTVAMIPVQSATIARLIQDGRVEVVGAMYDVVSREITFISDGGETLNAETLETEALT